MSNYGNIRLGDTFDAKFTSIDANGVGATLTDGAVAAYPGNSTTEITAGITLSANFDGRTGLNNVRVEATAGNGFAADTDYVLVLTAGTVDGMSVAGYVLGHFSIQKRVSEIEAVNGIAVTGSGTEVDPWRGV